MKTKKTIIFAGLITAILTAIFFSCTGPIGLGEMLDIEGPVVEFTSPSPRAAVQSPFEITGRVWDKSTIARLLLTASLNREPIDYQWQYTKAKGCWEESSDNGATWTTLEGAEWNGSANNAEWKVPINLSYTSGEYLFAVQAWDFAGSTDENSYKTLVLIIDTEPPSVEIVNPFLFGNRFTVFDESLETSNPELFELHHIKKDDDSSATGWQNPSHLGKFLTREFELRWMIDDNLDIKSIEILFVKYDVEIDDIPETPINSDIIIFSHRETVDDSAVGVKPNGRFDVPKLNLTEKTTVRVVGLCYDMAGNPNEEKTLGYFIYWPQADYPWIAFPEGMGRVDFTAQDDAYMIYPGRSVKAMAYQAHILDRVEYSIYQCTEDDDGKITGIGSQHLTSETLTPESTRSPSIFSWAFPSPNKAGYYVIKATPYGLNPVIQGETIEALFRVQDVSFPDLEVTAPKASEPLFMAMEDGKITISGTASDATEIESVTMVWINPESRNFAAMSQLQYFRDGTYQGWLQAKALAPGNSAYEHSVAGVDDFPYDPANPNKVWKLEINFEGENEYHRKIYSFSQEIDLLADLNLGIGGNPLKSQVFMLRAENPSEKTSIITYAPQGDELAPRLLIEKVVVTKTDSSFDDLIPGEWAMLKQFGGGETIKIDGTWNEDSTEYLSLTDNFYNNMYFEVNGLELKHGQGGVTVNFTPPDPNGSAKATSGRFTVTANVGSSYTLTAESLSDTLAVSAKVIDIGGNPSEMAASWLIESDLLRFLRISSTDADKAYKKGDKINIFLEFSKPVTLTNRDGTPPVLFLNSSGTGTQAMARYGRWNHENNDYEPQVTENTRQFFVYEVGEGHTTGTGFLNVTGLSVNDGVSEGDNDDWDKDDYPFTWEYNYIDGEKTANEEIRVTRQSDHNNKSIDDVQHHNLPVNGQDSLGAGKNILIDTEPPVVVSATPNPAGWHKEGDTINIAVLFSEPVRIANDPQDGNPPDLRLNTGNVTDGEGIAINPRLNGETITFTYTVRLGDNTANAPLTPVTITDFHDSITDVPGTTMEHPLFNKPVAGLYLDNTPPAPPTVAIRNANGDITPTAPTNLYDTVLSIQITASGSGPANLAQTGGIQYSINGGTSWVNANGTTTITLDTSGEYKVRARQIDQAGNISNVSSIPDFKWNPGALVTSINSFVANGEYTNNTNIGGARADEIGIIVDFRIPLTFPASSGNARPGIVLNTNPVRTVYADAATNVRQLSFNYIVAPEDTTNGAQLAVTGFVNMGSVTDEDSVNVYGYIALPANGSRLQDLKDIVIVTGPLEISTEPAFTTVAVAEDGSYPATLQVVFNRNIVKRSGQITIIQSAANYRLPAVLTDAQRSRFRGIAGFDTYYTRGTNGYVNDAADTSTKYILRYDINTADLTGLTDIAAVQTFAEAFRQAESINISVNSSAVTISGSTLNIALTGSNALQVPGAVYEVTLPAGLVQDTFSNPSPAPTPTAPSLTARNLTAGGIARPFIRVQRAQDTVRIETVSNNRQARIRANQPLTTNARLDCRTPGTTIYYFTGTAETYVSYTGNNITDQNWSAATFPPDDTTTPAAPSLPSDPQTTTNDRQTYSAPITIGGTTITNANGTTTADTTIGNVQGLQWRIRAKATTSTATPPANTAALWSADAEEMAYRSVLTYRIRTLGTDLGQNLGSGDQIWVRGGDAIGSSNIPGHPLTWEDDWGALTGRRAGIRLLDLAVAPTGNNDTLNTASTWRWVTWEINVPTYFDFIMGHDPDSDAAVATQYGPRQYAYQRAGWTSYKDYYRMNPGKHRWMYVNAGSTDAPGNGQNKGSISFALPFMVRPTLAVTYPPMP